MKFLAQDPSHSALHIGNKEEHKEEKRNTKFFVNKVTTEIGRTILSK